MPRPAVCIEVVNRRGAEWRVKTPGRGDMSYFAVKDAKKLQTKTFSGAAARYLVLNGAGGGVACAAMLALSEAPDIVVDQTLYWSLVTTEDEAWYRVGLINTDALPRAIREFAPEGELGPRHLHTLPNRLIPPFGPANLDHAGVTDLAKRLSALAQPLIDEDRSTSDPSKPIASHRRRLRNKLAQLDEMVALEDLAATVLGVAG